MLDPREEFKNIIREIAQEEAKNLLQTEDVYKSVLGTVIGVGENGTYQVDIVTTILNNIINISGSKLNLGDTVIVNEKFGSNYANCYISGKTGQSSKTIEDTEKETNKKIDETNKKMENQISNIFFRIKPGTTTRIEYSIGGDGIWHTLSID